MGCSWKGRGGCPSAKHIHAMPGTMEWVLFGERANHCNRGAAAYYYRSGHRARCEICIGVTSTDMQKSGCKIQYNRFQRARDFRGSPNLSWSFSTETPNQSFFFTTLKRFKRRPYSRNQWNVTLISLGAPRIIFNRSSEIRRLDSRLDYIIQEITTIYGVFFRHCNSTTTEQLDVELCG